MGAPWINLTPARDCMMAFVYGRLNPLSFAVLVLLAVQTTAVEPALPVDPPIPPSSAPAKPAPGSAANNEKKEVPSENSSLEALKLPSGAVVVLCEHLTDAFKLVPRGVIIPPLELQKLQDRIEQLQRQVRNAKPDAPSVCRLKGHIEGDLAKIHAQFEFRTDRPKCRVNLGCRRAWPTAATLDGQAPAAEFRDDGFIIQVDSPGAHQATLDLSLPIVSRRGLKGADRGLDLDLPRAAISVLEQFDFPAGASEIHCGSRPIQPKTANPQLVRIEAVPLSSIDHLELAWRGLAAEGAKGRPVLKATGKINVHVNEAHLTTDVDLTLQVLRGETQQWRIHFPLAADASLDVKLQPQDEARVLRIDKVPDKYGLTLDIHLKEPSADLMHVALAIRQTRAANTAPVGPFTVLEALTQKGEIVIHAPDELRPYYQVGDGVSQRDVNEDERREKVVAAFTYFNLPAPPEPPQPIPGLVTLKVETVKGAVETRVAQVLRLVQGEGEELTRWQLTTKIEVTPFRTPVDRLEITVPPGYEYDKEVGATPSEIVEDVVIDSQAHTGQIKLAQKQSRPFSVTLTGSYAVHSGRQEAVLELPRPLAWSLDRGVRPEQELPPTAQQPAPTSHPVLDRGGQVAVSLPEGVELVAGDARKGSAVVHDPFHLFLSPLRFRPSGQEYSWHTDRALSQIELTWRPQQPELSARTVVDITLAGKQARVVQQLQFQFSQTPPVEVFLRVPAELRERLQVIDGGMPSPDQPNPQTWWAIKLAAPAGKEHRLTLSYSFDLRPPKAQAAGEESRFSVPLVQPLPGVHGETKIRVWCDADVQPSVGGGRWEELATEVVAKHDSVPALVLRGNLGSPLALRVRMSSNVPIVSAVVDRVLVRAALTEQGVQTYRVRFLLSKLTKRSLEIALPAIVRGLEVRLDDKQLRPEFVDGGGHAADVGRLVRVSVEPELYTQPVILDVRFRLDVGRLEENAPFQTVLQPPELTGALLLGRIRWLVELPIDCIPLYASGGFTLEEQWGWRGRLLAPRPVVSGRELAQWLGDPQASELGDDIEPSLSCWQTSPGGLTLTYFPQRFWLLVCSLTLLAVGLALFFIPLPRPLFWSCLAILGLATAAAGVLWPGVLSVVIYGCEPGLVTLLVLLTAHGLLQFRQRRRAASLSGFARLQPGSSFIRSAPSDRPRSLSTIDDPLRAAGAGVPEQRSSVTGPGTITSAPGNA